MSKTNKILLAVFVPLAMLVLMFVSAVVLGSEFLFNATVYAGLFAYPPYVVIMPLIIHLAEKYA